MRPRKLVLVMDGDEFQRSRRAFLLETRLYRVVRAETSAEALALLTGSPPGVVAVLLAQEPLGRSLDGLVREAKAYDPELRVVVTASRKGLLLESCADAYLPADHTPAELMERIRILATRKRGPKVPRAVPAVPPAAVAGLVAVAAAERRVA